MRGTSSFRSSVADLVEVGNNSAASGSGYSCGSACPENLGATTYFRSSVADLVEVGNSPQPAAAATVAHNFRSQRQRLQLRPLPSKPHTPEANVVVAVIRRVVVAIGATRVDGIVVPTAAA